MNPFIAETDRILLKKHQLNSFESLWQLQLDAVDEPNNERGGWSTVSQLTLDGTSYYLKRQSNHLSRSLAHPFSEPTFAREFRNIQHYQKLGINTLTVAFFATRKTKNQEKQAILMTHALTGWQDLESYLISWKTYSELTKSAIAIACGQLLRQLHTNRIMHGCFYPKHIFLKNDGNNNFQTCIIDLEKTRPLFLGKRDRIKDMETFFRRTKHYWNESLYLAFLSSYLDHSSSDQDEAKQWLTKVLKRNQDKEHRA